MLPTRARCAHCRQEEKPGRKVLRSEATSITCLMSRFVPLDVSPTSNVLQSDSCKHLRTQYLKTIVYCFFESSCYI